MDLGRESVIDNLTSHVLSLLTLTHTTTRHQTAPPAKQDHNQIDTYAPFSRGRLNLTAASLNPSLNPEPHDVRSQCFFPCQ